MPKSSSQKKITLAARKEILDSTDAMGEAARKGDVQAFTALLKAGGMIEGGGIKITNNVGVDARNHGNTQADWNFFKKFQGRLSSSLMRKALPGPDEGEDAGGPVPQQKEAVPGVEHP